MTTDAKCPSTHPDEVIYEMWLGTKYVCDCLEQEKDRRYESSTCEGDGARKIDAEDKPQDDCYHVKGLPPVIQSKIRGVRYCGSRSKLSFREM